LGFLWQNKSCFCNAIILLLLFAKRLFEPVINSIKTFLGKVLVTLFFVYLAQKGGTILLFLITAGIHWQS